MRYIAVVFVTLSCPSCCMHVITPVEHTNTSIGETFVRIGIYAERNQEMPRSLDVLPKRSSYANDITDGWKRPLRYDVRDDGIVTLESLGRDGKPGGTGEDQDISRRYYWRKADGSLWAGSDMWIVEGEVR